jgi:hypothetical protein
MLPPSSVYKSPSSALDIEEAGSFETIITA